MFSLVLSGNKTWYFEEHFVSNPVESIFFPFLVPAYVVRREVTVFTGVCLSTEGGTYLPADRGGEGTYLPANGGGGLLWPGGLATLARGVCPHQSGYPYPR